MTNARDLTVRLADLLHRERSALADFLVLLAEFDRRRLWLELGHASLFSFLHRELGLSKGAAHYRKTAAELVQRFPEVVEPLRQGKLCITSIVELAKVLSPENREEVLPRFFHCSKREAAEVAAALRPDEGAPRRELVTALRPVAPTASAEAKRSAPPWPPIETAPQSVQPAEHLDANSVSSQPISSSQPHEGLVAAPPIAPRTAALHVRGEPAPATTNLGRFPAPRDAVEPLTADLRRLHVTVSRRFLSKLEAARAALSHARPGASAEDILEAGLDLLLANDAKRKGQVEKPLATIRPAKPNHVPASVKREVWRRDGGRCTWPLASGGVCGSSLRVQFDHLVPRARGGPSTVANVRLLCAVHNQYAARLVFGGDWMARYGRGAARSMETSRDVQVRASSRIELQAPVLVTP